MLGHSSSINHTLSWDAGLGCFLATDSQAFLVYGREDAGRISSSPGKDSEMNRLYHLLQHWYHKGSLPAWSVSVEGKSNTILSALCPHNQDGSLGLDPLFLLVEISWLLPSKFPHEKASSLKGIFQKLSAIMLHFRKSLV